MPSMSVRVCYVFCDSLVYLFLCPLFVFVVCWGPTSRFLVHSCCGRMACCGRAPFVCSMRPSKVDTLSAVLNASTLLGRIYYRQMVHGQAMRRQHECTRSCDVEPKQTQTTVKHASRTTNTDSNRSPSLKLTTGCDSHGGLLTTTSGARVGSGRRSANTG